MSQFEDTQLGVKIITRDLTQGNIERYTGAMREFDKPDSRTDEYYGAVLRSVIKAGWIETFYRWGADQTDGVEKWLQQPALTVDSVTDMRPLIVRWMAKRMGDVYQEATEVPPE
jgi:hypothetical protein